MSDTSSAAVAAAATPPRVTPTVTQSIRVDWGSWLAQALDHEEHIIAAAAGAAGNLALKSMPMGTIVSMFLGPKLIEQYVLDALNTLEGVLQPMGTSLDVQNPWLTAILNKIIKTEPGLAAWLGDELEPMIKAALAKFGIAA